MYFSYDFGWYSIHLDSLHNVGWVLLKQQNMLRETKVICQQSHTYGYIS